MLVGMDTLISIGLLVVALIPLCIALRDVLTDDGPRPKNSAATFFDADSDPSTFPSLATLQELEHTAPTFVKRNEWWTE
jgi:hypothetical protein